MDEFQSGIEFIATRIRNSDVGIGGRCIARMNARKRGDLKGQEITAKSDQRAVKKKNLCGKLTKTTQPMEAEHVRFDASLDVLEMKMSKVLHRQ